MSDVIEQFQGLPDRQAAEAFSEVYLRMADLKVSTYSIEKTQKFPPEPSWFTAVASAYLEKPDANGIQAVRRQFTMVSNDNHEPEAIATAFITDYRQQVGTYQDIANTAIENVGGVDSVFDNLGRRASELAREARMRTVASFVVYSADKSDKQYTGLLIPRRTFEQIPLEDREQWIQAIQMFESSTGVNLVSDGPPQVRQVIRGILQNDPKQKHYAFLAGALNLPPVDRVERSIDASLSQGHADKYAGMTRAERREAQLKERRAARKKNPEA